MIIGLITKSKEGEKKNTYAQLIETSKTEVADLAFDKTINGNNNFDFNDIYSKPFFTNNYDIIGDNIVKKNTNTPIISKADYEKLLKPSFNNSSTSTVSTPSTPSPSTPSTPTPSIPTPTPSTPSTPTPPPSIPNSNKPQMYVISNRDRYITGKGIAGAKIEVTLPNGTVYNTTVSNNGDWNVVTNYLAVGSTVKAIQKENGKNNSEASVQTVVQAQDLVIGNNQLEFNVKTTVPVRVFIIFKGSSLGASMNMLGGNINVAGGTRSIFRTENITF